MTAPRSKNEDIKEASRFLRGTIAEGLAEVITGAIAEDDAQLTKFHGTYLQDDRDLRARAPPEEAGAGLFLHDPRARAGRRLHARAVARDGRDRRSDFANGTLRLTTRQAFQFHGVIKGNLKPTMQAINAALLDTVAACGDVNRNVMCNPNPHQSRAHAAALGLARAISDHLMPRTAAYHEIWLDGEKVVDTEAEEEPIYGRHYLPRKFKTVVAVPPSNDVDVFAQDLGFIAITDEAGEVAGYDVTVGGGMGMTHGEPETYPRTADVMALLHARAGGRGRREGGERAARLRRPREPQARAPQVHDRGPRPRLVPRRGRAPPRLRAGGPAAVPVRAIPATATAGSRTTRAAGTTRCSSRTAASRTRPTGR